MQTVLKFTMHIKCLRCDVKVDSTTNIVTVSGVGRLIWRSEYFPRVAHSCSDDIYKKLTALCKIHRDGIGASRAAPFGNDGHCFVRC